MNELTTITITIRSNSVRSGDLLNDEVLQAELKIANKIRRQIEDAARAIIAEMHQFNPAMFGAIETN